MFYSAAVVNILCLGGSSWCPESPSGFDLPKTWLLGGHLCLAGTTSIRVHQASLRAKATFVSDDESCVI